MDENTLKNKALELAVGAVVKLGVQRFKDKVTDDLRSRFEDFLASNISESSKVKSAIIQILEDNNTEIDNTRIDEVVTSVQKDLALKVSVEGGGVGRVLKNSASETIHGSQEISVKNGGIGEIVDGSRKVIISENGSGPALSTQVINHGTGMKVVRTIDNNGVSGGLTVIKTIK